VLFDLTFLQDDQMPSLYTLARVCFFQLCKTRRAPWEKTARGDFCYFPSTRTLMQDKDSVQISCSDRIATACVSATVMQDHLMLICTHSALAPESVPLLSQYFILVQF